MAVLVAGCSSEESTPKADGDSQRSTQSRSQDTAETMIGGTVFGNGPVAGAIITLTDEDGEPIDTETEESSQRGTFLLTADVPGRFVVVATGGSDESGDVPVPLRATVDRDDQTGAMHVDYVSTMATDLLAERPGDSVAAADAAIFEALGLSSLTTHHQLTLADEEFSAARLVDGGEVTPEAAIESVVQAALANTTGDDADAGDDDGDDAETKTVSYGAADPLVTADGVTLAGVEESGGSLASSGLAEDLEEGGVEEEAAGPELPVAAIVGQIMSEKRNAEIMKELAAIKAELDQVSAQVTKVQASVEEVEKKVDRNYYQNAIAPLRSTSGAITKVGTFETEFTFLWNELCDHDGKAGLVDPKTCLPTGATDPTFTDGYSQDRYEEDMGELRAKANSDVRELGSDIDESIQSLQDVLAGGRATEPLMPTLGLAKFEGLKPKNLYTIEHADQLDDTWQYYDAVYVRLAYVRATIEAGGVLSNVDKLEYETDPTPGLAADHLKQAMQWRTDNWMPRRPTFPQAAGGGRIVIDVQQQRMWLDAPPTLTDGDAGSVQTRRVNASKPAGYDDWRMPTIPEYEALFASSANAPKTALSAIGFTKSIAAPDTSSKYHEAFRSSTTYGTHRYFSHTAQAFVRRHYTTTVNLVNGSQTIDLLKCTVDSKPEYDNDYTKGQVFPWKKCWVHLDRSKFTKTFIPVRELTSDDVDSILLGVDQVYDGKTI